MCCAGAATRTFGLMPLCLVTAAARAPTEPSQRWLPPAVAVTERAVAAEPVVPVGLAIVPAGTERDPARPHPSQHLPPRLSLLSYRRGAAPLSPTTDMLDLRGDSAWLPVGCRRRLYEQSEPRDTRTRGSSPGEHPEELASGLVTPHMLGAVFASARMYAGSATG